MEKEMDSVAVAECDECGSPKVGVSGSWCRTCEAGVTAEATG